jgi:hypothetical protein
MAEQQRCINVPSCSVFFEDIYRKDPGMSAEEVYEILKKECKENGSGGKKIKIKLICPGSGSGGSGKEFDGQSLSEEELLDLIKQYGKENITVEVERDGKKFEMGLDTLVGPDESIEEIKANTQEMINSARELWASNAIEKGNLPGGVSQYINAILEVQLPWDKIMESAILYTVQNAKRRTWTMPNIYIRKPRLPGRLSGISTQKLLCGYDSSGSVGDSDLKKFSGALTTSAPYYGSLKVFVHDYTVQQELDVHNMRSKEQVYQALKEIKGRGGTSHKDLFDKIEYITETEKVSTILFLTDACSDIAQIAADYKFLRENRTIWVLNADVDMSQILDKRIYDYYVIRIR